MFREFSRDILSWKKKYKDIYGKKIGDNIYIYRTLTRGEFFSALDMQKKSSYDVNDFVLELCLLYPKYDKNTLDGRLAGEIDYLINSVSNLSGFSDGEKLIKDVEEERSKVGLLDNQIVLTICKAFPQLTPDDLDNLNYNQLLHYLVLAEEILDTKLNIQKPIDQSKIDFEEDNRRLNGNTGGVSKKRKVKRGDAGK